MMATNAQLEARIKALEAWQKTATAQIQSLMTAPAVDYSAQITELTDAIAELKNTTCPEAGRLSTIEAALAVLTDDHVPEP